MSHNDLKKIAKLRKIKKYSTLLKEDIIHTLLRSKKASNENNYMKYIKNNVNEKIKDKINIIKIELLKLSNIITGKDRDDIKEELQDITKKQILQKHKKIIYTITSLKLRDFNTIKKNTRNLFIVTKIIMV